MENKLIMRKLHVWNVSEGMPEENKKPCFKNLKVFLVSFSTEP